MELLDDSSRKIRYVIVPGVMHSEADGQPHYIGALALMKLYGVRHDECTVYDHRLAAHSPNYHGIHKWKLEELIPLRPQYRGNYTLPARREENG